MPNQGLLLSDWEPNVPIISYVMPEITDHFILTSAHGGLFWNNFWFAIYWFLWTNSKFLLRDGKILSYMSAICNNLFQYRALCLIRIMSHPAATVVIVLLIFPCYGYLKLKSCHPIHWWFIFMIYFLKIPLGKLWKKQTPVWKSLAQFLLRTKPSNQLHQNDPEK